MAEAERRAMIFDDGPLDKASIIFLDDKGKEKSTLPVQFNPEKYSIKRTMDYKETNGIGREIHPFNVQPNKGRLATLKVHLILDSSTEFVEMTIPKQFEKHVDEKNELAKICFILSLLTKYEHESHLPPKIQFSWGSLHFVGHATNVEIQYEMFNRAGMPVRVGVDLTMDGEEKEILTKIKVNPNESPDRTKFRTLGQVDELWMLAEDEYDDCLEWRAIARENNILNPRKVDYTKLLKVPSI